MRRLSTQLVLSHAVVAVIGAIATLLVVRSVAPTFFNQGMMRGRGPNHTGDMPALDVRNQFIDAIDQALLVGTLVGVVAAMVFGVLLAYRLSRPLAEVRSATREIARGNYAADVPRSTVLELSDLADDVSALGTQLGEIETRRARLLGEVAHEMRTPLTVIDGYVEAMIDGVLPSTPAELNQISEEVRRLRRLSEDLSALSRAEEGRLELDPAEVDLAGLVGEVAARMRPQFEDAGVELATSSDGPVRAVADADRIAQVVTNLLGNALRATAPGGRVAVSATTTGTGTEAATEIRVSDTGEGIAPEDLERIFERFYRVGGRRQDPHDTGSGIGLTIARGIVRAHGGELVASSPGPGQGAVFTVRLPG